MNIDPALFFQALSDQTRLRCLASIQAAGELCVCELTQALVLAQPKISRHLGVLREIGVAADRRDGLWVYYRINPDLPAWARTVIEATVAGIADTEPYAGDRGNLAQAATRRERCSA